MQTKFVDVKNSNMTISHLNIDCLIYLTRYTSHKNYDRLINRGIYITTPMQISFPFLKDSNSKFTDFSMEISFNISINVFEIFRQTITINLYATSYKSKISNLISFE